MEEYSIAAQVWKLSSSDMAEMAKISVLRFWGSKDNVKLKLSRSRGSSLDVRLRNPSLHTQTTPTL